MVTNTELSGAIMANITVVSESDKSSAPAPFVVGDKRKGAFCGVEISSADNLFVLYSEANVLSRFGSMDDSNAEHFACVKIEYLYVNRTVAWSYLNLSHLDWKVHPIISNNASVMLSAFQNATKGGMTGLWSIKKGSSVTPLADGWDDGWASYSENNHILVDSRNVSDPLRQTLVAAQCCDTCNVSVWVQIDLGEPMLVTEINRWLFGGDAGSTGRSYCTQRAVLSLEDNFSANFTAFSCGTYAECGEETLAGKTVRIDPPRAARYVRYYSSRSSIDSDAHFTEVTVRGHKLPIPTTPALFNCTATVGQPWPLGYYMNTTTNETINCTLPSNTTTPTNQTVHMNSSQFYVNHTTWRVYNGAGWEIFAAVPTDVLVANISNGVVSAMSSGGVEEYDIIGGITAGFVFTDSDLVFTAGQDSNVMVSGDFLTPPVVALMGNDATLFRTGPHDANHLKWKQDSPPIGLDPWVTPKDKSLVGSAKITDAGGSAILFLQVMPEKTVQLGVRIEFSFYVLNPVHAQSEQRFTISASSGCAAIAAQDMLGLALKVTSPQLIEKQAGQSSPVCTHAQTALFYT